MIKITMGLGGSPLLINATVSGLAIYLDNHSLIGLAKGNPSRRTRFVDALHSGADLMFSVTNAAELAGPQGRSRDFLRAFLDEVGPHWFPVELDAFEVIKREGNGASPAQSCVSKQFLKDYFDQFLSCKPNSGKIIDLNFLRLGAVLDWVGPQRESIRKGSTDMDNALIKRIEGYCTEVEQNPSWLDQRFPIVQFNPSMPATFTYISLVRTLIVEAKAYALKKNDGLDFFHAVMASAFASVATLDKHWKRRVDNLPKPNGLASIYYEPQLDKMMTDIELWLKHREAVRLESLS